MDETFQIRILNAAQRTYWYSNKIGHIFIVRLSSYNKGRYEVVNNTDLFIDIADCEVIEEPTLTKEEAEKHTIKNTTTEESKTIRRETATQILAGIMANPEMVQGMSWEHMRERAIIETDELLKQLGE